MISFPTHFPTYRRPPTATYAVWSKRTNDARFQPKTLNQQTLQEAAIAGPFKRADIQGNEFSMRNKSCFTTRLQERNMLKITTELPKGNLFSIDSIFEQFSIPVLELDFFHYLNNPSPSNRLPLERKLGMGFFSMNWFVRLKLCPNKVFFEVLQPVSFRGMSLLFRKNIFHKFCFRALFLPFLYFLQWCKLNVSLGDEKKCFLTFKNASSTAQKKVIFVA